MTNRQAAALMLPGLLVLAGVIFAGHELHRSRLASEDTAAKLGALISNAGPKHAVCAKADSGLDHDVDMGPILACPNPDDGQCVTVDGKPAPVSVAVARCKAGKL